MTKRRSQEYIKKEMAAKVLRRLLRDNYIDTYIDYVVIGIMGNWVGIEDGKVKVRKMTTEELLDAKQRIATNTELPKEYTICTQ